MFPSSTCACKRRRFSKFNDNAIVKGNAATAACPETKAATVPTPEAATDTYSVTFSQLRSLDIIFNPVFGFSIQDCMDRVNT